jgi:hypothetical protein
MNSLARTLSLTVSMLSLATLVAAAPPPCGPARNDAALLEDTRDRVAWEAHNAKGVDKQQLKEEEHRLQWMIDELHRGGRVEPDDIDRELNRS